MFRCPHCDYLFEAEQPLCPTCGREASADLTDAPDEGRRTTKRPPIRVPPDEP